MDLQQLKYFLALADAGNFHIAAENIGLTQSALTQSIAKLEKDLGVELFVRSHTGTRLTAHGARLLHHAQVILAQVQAAETEFTARSGARGIELSVGVMPIFPDSLILSILEQMRSHHAYRRVKIVKDWSSELLTMLERGVIDFAFVSDHFTTDSVPEITREAMFQDQVQVVVGEDHPLYTADSVELAQLAEYEWVAVSIKPQWTEFLAQTFAAIDLPPPQKLIQTNSYTLAVELIGHGHAVGLVSAKAIETAGEHRYRFFDVRELRQRRIFSLCRRTRMVLRPYHRKFMELFAASVKSEFDQVSTEFFSRN